MAFIKRLTKKGMKFGGSTIIYSYLQAIGLYIHTIKNVFNIKIIKEITYND